MKIVVDINHPAHVHYFKNFIWEMQKKGHEFLITTSDKDISLKLLNLYQLPYIKGLITVMDCVMNTGKNN